MCVRASVCVCKYVCGGCECVCMCMHACMHAYVLSVCVHFLHTHAYILNSGFHASDIVMWVCESR